MKKYIHLHILLMVAAALFFNACKKDYGNLNNATVEDLTKDATQPELNNLVSGTESGMRNVFALYLDDVGTLGREMYHFSTSEPRYVLDLLGANGAQLSSSNFYITNPWAARYRVVKNCNVLIQAANHSTFISAEQKKGYTGFAQTIKAYQMLLNLNLTDTIRVDVTDPDHLGPFVGYDDGLAAISSILDSGYTDLNGASIAFTLAGFGNFGSAAGLAQFNRAISARVKIYQQKWTDALDALNGSFFDLTQDLNLGVFHVFGTGSGDQLNGFFIPQKQFGDARVAHPTFFTETDSLIDDRLSKAPPRPTYSFNGLTAYRDVWVSTSSTAPFPIIRNEELILIYAEANIQTDNLDEGVKAINIIRNAHNLPGYTGAVTHDDLITEMLIQRKYSLFCEGHRWIDVRRYNLLNTLPIDRPGDQVFSEFPLPVTEQ